MRRDAGFTTLELLVTVSLLLLLVGFLSMQYEPIKEQRRLAIAREELKRLRDAIEAHRTVSGDSGLPSTFAIVPALQGSEWFDPWGNPYGLTTSGPAVYSTGPDGELSTEDDLSMPLSRGGPRPRLTGRGPANRR